MSHDDIDPITLEVVCEGLRDIVKEVRATIIRASFSSVTRAEFFENQMKTVSYD